METDRLTDEQIALAFALCEIESGGWTPTLVEVGERIDRVPSSLHARLGRMVEAGLLESHAYGERNLQYRASRKLLAEVAGS